MRKFAYATVLAIALSAPVFTGALMDHSMVSVLGGPPHSPGPCNRSCDVGGAGNGGIVGAAEGGYVNIVHSHGGLDETTSGTLAVGGTAGRFSTPSGAQSGNSTQGAGHCTGLPTC
jgi:hypothetical protein